MTQAEIIRLPLCFCVKDIPENLLSAFCRFRVRFGRAIRILPRQTRPRGFGPQPNKGPTQTPGGRSAMNAFQNPRFARCSDPSPVCPARGAVRLRLEELESRLTPTGVFPQFNLVDPAGSVDFGAEVVPLSTGNVVVTDPLGNGGAAYLFNGQTGALHFRADRAWRRADGDRPHERQLRRGQPELERRRGRGDVGQRHDGSRRHRLRRQQPRRTTGSITWAAPVAALVAASRPCRTATTSWTVRPGTARHGRGDVGQRRRRGPAASSPPPTVSSAAARRPGGRRKRSLAA